MSIADLNVGDTVFNTFITYLRMFIHKYNVFTSITHAHTHSLNIIQQKEKHHTDFEGRAQAPRRSRTQGWGGERSEVQTAHSPPNTPPPTSQLVGKDILKVIPPSLRSGGDSLSLSAQRRLICANCEFRKGKRCSLCGCWIVLKTAAPWTYCPMARW